MFFGGLRANTQTILNAPVTEKYSILMEDDKMRAGASSMQGWRSTMEDAHAIYLSLPKLPSTADEDGAIAAVFDGHCGSKVSQTAAGNVLHWLTESPSYHRGEFGKALREAYLQGDAYMHKHLHNEHSGCTGVSILVVQNHLYCANAGDSRAVLCRNGIAMPLSDDHKPTKLREKERILRAGGFVQNGRVNGVLSLSRAFGDYAFKDYSLPADQHVISVNPDVVHLELDPQDEFVVIACDGVWDVMTNEEVVEFVRHEVGDHSDLSLAAERLMDRCLSTTPDTYGTDNMTVIILQFKSFLLKQIEDKYWATKQKQSGVGANTWTASATEAVKPKKP